MKIVFRTVAFHVICIIIFALLYSTFAEDFGSLDDEIQYQNGFNINKIKEKRGFIDFLLLSTTIQAGVGISEFFPSSIFTKIILIIQQIIMIFTHVFTIYLFTL